MTFIVTFPYITRSSKKSSSTITLCSLSVDLNKPTPNMESYECGAEALQSPVGWLHTGHGILSALRTR